MSYDIHIAKDQNQASLKAPDLSITFGEHNKLCSEVELSSKPYLRDILDFYKDVTIKGSGKQIMLEEIKKLNLNELSETVSEILQKLQKVIKTAIEKGEDIHFIAD